MTFLERIKCMFAYQPKLPDPPAAPMVSQEEQQADAAAMHAVRETRHDIANSFNRDVLEVEELSHELADIKKRYIQGPGGG